MTETPLPTVAPGPARPTAFDVCGPLPTGTTVLEASAGTGKTYTIAALAARYVAEGQVELDELMIVTFGRMATDELRVRVRERLVSLEASSPSAGRRVPGPPRRGGSGQQAADRRRRRGAGAAARAGRPRPGRLRRGDHRHHPRVLPADAGRPRRARRPGAGRRLRRAARRPDRARWPATSTCGVTPPSRARRCRSRKRQAGRAGGRGRSDTRLVPCARRRRPVRSRRAGGVRHEAVRAEVQRRKRAGSAVQLRRHADPAARRPGRPRHGEAAARRLRQRYRVVLVDEFQDTDPIQWEILRRAFHGTSPDLDRRPQAGDLRLPGRRRLQLSRRGRAGRSGRAPWAPTGAATRPWWTRWTLIGRRQLWATTRSWSARCGADHPEPAADRDRTAAAVDAGADPAAGRSATRRMPSRRPAWRRCARGSRATWWPTSPRCWPRDAAGCELDGDGPAPVRPADHRRPGPHERARRAIRDALVTAGVPAVHARFQLGLRLAGGPGLADLADRARTAAAAAVRQAALTCFFGWTFARLAAGRRTGPDRADPTRSAVEPGAGRPRGGGPAGGGDRRRRG